MEQFTQIITNVLSTFGQNIGALGVFSILGFGGFVIYSFLKSKTSKLKETIQTSINKKVEQLEKTEEDIKEDKQKIINLEQESQTIQDDIKKEIIQSTVSNSEKPKTFAEIQKQIESGWKDI